MDITKLDQQNYADLFAGQGDAGKPPGTVNFSASGPQETNILVPSSVTETTTVAPDSSTTDTTTLVPTEGQQDTDILGTGKDPAAPDPKDVQKPLDFSSYYEDRIKAGKFVAIEEEGENGQKKTFIPKTLEDFDEVIDIQVNYQLDQRRKEAEDKWYQSKSPAWQAVAKYAEMADDPAEILPFIQGVKTIDSVENLDPTDLVAAEQIVKARLLQRGDTEEIIQEQLESLKSTDKLTSTAQKYKPLILKQEQAQLAQMVQQKQAQEKEYQQLVTNIRTQALKAIEEPIYGKQTLKQEEKAALYELIAVPSEETQGYAIYNKIDSLFESGDFDTLKQVALLLANKESFMNYITAAAADKTAGDLQRKLRVATDSRNSSSNNGSETEANRSVQRNQYSPTPKFGRG